ncbi:TIM-barrel domain-containing protein [Bacteroidota bacterium]
MTNKFLLVVLFSFTLVQLSYAQRQAIIEEDIAVFYPAAFSSEKHLPSFALIKEFDEIGPLPNDWKVKPTFETVDGKSIAKIGFDKTTTTYGTGEVTGSLLRNNTAINLYNLDNLVWKRDHGTRLYQSHPWVLAVREDGTAFGILADNTWRQEITITDNEVIFSSESLPFRVLIIEKDNPKEVLAAFADITGKMSLPPLWSIGFQQCRWSYKTDVRVREIADTYRAKKIPCDVIWMDLHYLDKYKVFTFNSKRFPDPNATNDYLHSKGFRAAWTMDPGVKYEKNYSIYESGTKNDVWVKTSKNKPFRGTVWPGKCVFPDYTQKKVREWWGDLFKDWMAKGIDGVWNDMNEPSVFFVKGLTMPDDNIHFGDDEIKKDIHVRYHNVYGMLMTKATMEGLQKANPDKRPFILTRSSYIGGQRYAATWTGDNKSSWEQLKMSIPMSINLGISGQPFSGADIGGFSGHATAELFGHWIGIGTFYPFSRTHTMQGTKDQEPWVYGEEIENVSRKSIERRYRLMPYLYTQFYNASITGVPIMQPAFFADFSDTKLRDDDEIFLFGPDLLIIPKWAEHYDLPKGNWQNLIFEGEEGEEYDTYLPEVKLRPGAIVPMAQVIQSTADYKLDTLDLYIALDASGFAEGQLYHDAGEGYGYKNNEYALLTIQAKQNGDNVQIEVVGTQGEYDVANKQVNVFLLTDGKTIKAQGSLKEKITLSLK